MTQNPIISIALNIKIRMINNYFLNFIIIIQTTDMRGWLAVSTRDRIRLSSWSSLE